MDIGRLAQIISKVFSGDSLVASKDRAPQTSRLRLEALETRELLDASSLFQAPTIESTIQSKAFDNDVAPILLNDEILDKIAVEHNAIVESGVDRAITVDASEQLELEGAVALTAPKLSVSEKTENSITVSWNKVEGATKYYLAYAPNGGSFTTESVPANATSYTLSDLGIGETYSFKIRAIGDGSATTNSKYGDVLSVTTSTGIQTLSTPTLSVAVRKTNAITVSWTQVSGATGYLFEYMTENASEYTSVKLAASKFQRQVSGLTEGEIVDFRVTALGSGDFQNSNPAELTVATQQTLATPDVSLTEATDSSLSFSWSEVENALGYRVMYVRAGDSAYTTVNVGSKTSFTLNGLQMETSYSLKVAALGDGDAYKTSPYSTLTAYWTINPFKLQPPTVTATDASNDSVLLHWDSVPNATKYYVAWAPAGSTKFTTKSVAATKTYFQVTGLDSNTEYQFKLRSVSSDSSYINSKYSPVTTISTTGSALARTALAVPTMDLDRATATSFTVSWSADPRAVGYTVIYKEKSESAYTTVTLPATETSLTINDLAPNSNYYVKVRALGEGVFWTNSAYCATKVVKTPSLPLGTSVEYDVFRGQYAQLDLPASLEDVNVVELTDWSAQGLQSALEIARQTPTDDIILLDASKFANAPLDLSNVSFNFDLNFEESGIVTIASYGNARANIRVNPNDVTFNITDGRLQFGGLDLIGVNSETSTYQAVSTPSSNGYDGVFAWDDVNWFSMNGKAIDFDADSQNVPVHLGDYSENDYAFIFISGQNPEKNLYAFYQTMKECYADLISVHNVDPQNIYILYADGDTSGKKRTLTPPNGGLPIAPDLKFATSQNTTILPATGAGMTYALGQIGARMDSNSHLFAYVYGHGTGELGKINDYNDYIWGWGDTETPRAPSITSQMVRDAFFQIKEGYVTIAMGQCFSGGIIDDIVDPATNQVSSSYDGSAHFAVGASTNHYEYAYLNTSPVGDSYYYRGYMPSLLKGLRTYKINTSLFEYAERDDYFHASGSWEPNGGRYVESQKAEHPWHAGETFSVFAPTVTVDAPTLTASATTTSVTVDWNAVANATDYTIQYAISGGEFETIRTTDTAITIPGLVSGQTYVVQVRANGDGTNYGGSGYSVVTVTTLKEQTQLPAPAVTSLEATADAFTFTWNEIDHATSYTFKYVDPGTSQEVVVENYQGTSYSVSNFIPGATYVVQLRANGDGVEYLDSPFSTNNLTVQVQLNAPILSVSDVQPECVTVVWDAIDHAESYTIAKVDVNGQLAPITTTSDTTYQITDFVPGQTYVLKVRANAAEGSGYLNSEYSDANITIYVPYRLETTEITSWNSTTNSITINWDAVSNASNYTIEYSFDGVNYNAIGSTDQTSYTVQGLVSGTSYYFRIRANGDGTTYVNSDYSAPVNVSTQTPLAAPSGLAASVSGQEITTTWNAVPGASSYTLEYLVNGSSQPISVVVDGTSYAFVGVPGSTYTIRVQSNGDDVAYASSPFSQPVVSIVPTQLAAPTITAVDADAASITVEWNAVANASNYTISYYVEGGETKTETVSSTSYQILNVAPGETYVVTVQANGDGVEFVNSAPSAAASITVVVELAAPTITGVSVGVDSAEITWNEIANASGYTIAYAPQGSSDFTETVVSGTTQTISGLEFGGSYVVKVKANGNGGAYEDSEYSSERTFTVLTPLATPEITGWTPTTDSVTVNWNEVSGATSYTLTYVVYGTSQVVTIDDIAGSSYQIGNLTAGASYVVQVQANGDGAVFADSAPSDSVRVRTQEVLAPAPTIESTSATINSVTLTWNAVPNASGYAVAYAVAGSDAFQTVSVSGTIATIPGLASGSTYVFKVNAVGDGTSYVDSGYGPSVNATIKTKLDAPEVTASATTNSITVDWDAVANASGYTVAYAVDGTDNFTYANVSSTSYEIPNLASGSTYVVKVKANGDGALFVDSDYSGDDLTVTVKSKLQTPTLALDVSASSITVSWNEIAGASKYALEYAVRGSSEVTQATVNTTSYTIAGLAQGEDYVVRVKAVGDGTRYVDSDYAVAYPNTPDVLTEPVITDASASTDSVALNWSAVANASGYTIAYAVDGTTNFTSIPVNSTNYVINGLLSGTTYVIKVQANGAGDFVDSDFSDPVNVTVKTKLDSPTIASATATTDSVTINWGAIANASGYTIAYAPVGTTDWSTAPTKTTTETSYTLQGLVSGTTYVIKVKANGNGALYVDSDYSDPAANVTVKSKLATPRISASSNVDSITASWIAVPNASGYTVAYAPQGSSVFTEAVVANTTYTIPDLVSGETYVVKVKANGDNGIYVDSDYSSDDLRVTTLVKLNAPTITASLAPNATNAISATWNAIENASGYTVRYALEGTTDWSTAPMRTTTGTSITLTGLSSGVSYVVEVKANGNGTRYLDSDYSATDEPVWVPQKLRTPTITATSSTTDSVTINWRAVLSMGYTVAYAVSGTNTFTEMDPVMTTTNTIPGLVSGTTYDVKVKANGDGYESADSDYSPIVSVLVKTQLDAPAITAVSSTVDSATIAWNPVANATGYGVRYAIADTENWTVLDPTTETSVTIPGLTSGVTYAIEVMAQGDGAAYVDSDYSATTSVKALEKLDAPTITATNSDHSSVSVTWDAVANASGYAVTYAVAGTSDWSTAPQTTTDDTSITIPGLASGTRYVVKVKAVGDQTNYADSDYSATDSILVKTKLPFVPTITNATATTDSISATWTAVLNMGYTLEYAVSGSDDFNPIFVSATDYTIGNLESETTYDLRVKAKGDGNMYVDSDYSPIVSVTVKSQLSAPTISATRATTDAISVDWIGVDGASSYVVAYAVSGSDEYTTLNPVTTTSLTIPGLVSGKTYDVKVMAVGEGIYVSSDYSAPESVLVKTKLPLPDLNLDSAGISIIATWDAIEGAQSYALTYWLEGSTVTTMVAGITDASYEITPVISGMTYNVRLQAIGDDVAYVDSDYVQDDIYVQSKLPAPTITSTSSTPTSITLEWLPVVNAQEYWVSYRVSDSTESKTLATSDTTITINSLAERTDYEISVVAKSGDQGLLDSDPSVETIRTKQQLNPPTIIDIEGYPSCNSFTVHWTPVDNAIGYKLSYTQLGGSPKDLILTPKTPVGGVTQYVDSIPANTTSYTVSPATSGAIYKVQVLALGTGEYVDSDWSGPEMYTVPIKLETPTITVTPGIKSATVEWNAVENASSYWVAYKESSASEWYILDGELVSNAETSVTIDWLAGATSYDFRVVAHGDEQYFVDSEFSAVVSAIVKDKLESPVLQEPESGIDETTEKAFITVTWNPVDHAERYQVRYRAYVSTEWLPSTPPVTTETYYTFHDLEPGTPYVVEVTAIGDGVYYVNSDGSETDPEFSERLDKPVIVDTGRGLDYVSVYWDAVQDAAGYYVSIAPSGTGNWSEPEYVENTLTWTKEGLPQGTSYDVRVVAHGIAPQIDSLPALTPPIKTQKKLDPPTIIVTPGVNQATVSWTRVTNASGYRIQYKKSSASSWTTYSPDPSKNTTSVTITGLAGATSYDFRVMALGDGENGDYVNSEYCDKKSAVAQEKLPAPSISVTPGVYQATVSWNAIAHASGYKVEYKKSSVSNWSTHSPNPSSSATSVTIPGLTGATSYDFRVTALGDGIYYVNSDPSAVKSAIVKAKLSPTTLSVTGHTHNSISLKWNAIANASSYTLERQVGSSSTWETVSSSISKSATTYNVSGLSGATLYKFRIKGNGDNVYYVDSDWSNTVSQKTKETPSVVVNSTLDVIDAYDGNITLREALITYRAQGTTVTFTSGMAGKTITLGSQIALTQAATINASSLSSAVTVSGGNNTRIFSLSNASYTINKVNFTQGKSASTGGGAINLSSGSLAINNCAFTSNSAAGADEDVGTVRSGGGGAIYADPGATLNATDCTFTNNTVTGGRGGAVHAYCATANFTRCSFQSNTASGGGAIAYSNDQGSVSSKIGEIDNCLFAKNNAGTRGGGVALFKNVYVVFKNDTFAKNSAGQSGGGAYVWDDEVSHGVFYNCLFAGNSAGTTGHGQIGFNTTMCPNGYTNVEGYKTMANNVTWAKSGTTYTYDSTKPLFVNSNSDWRLTNDSQACGKGNNNHYPSGTDLAGNTRKVGSNVDLGCYENQSNSGALLDDDAELFDEFEDSLDLIAASLLG